MHSLRLTIGIIEMMGKSPKNVMNTADLKQTHK